MLLVLCGSAKEPQEVGARIARHLESTYPSLDPPLLVPLDAKWNRSPEWDDIVIVVYDSPQLPESITDYIAAFRDAHRTGGFIIPVAVDPRYLKPPAPISGVKALMFGDDAKGLDRVGTEVGVRLGLALRPGRGKIFISYRASDGKEIANDLNNRLIADGFEPWLDEARENLNPADDVQKIIHAQIHDAAMVIVVDTPDSPQSDWMFQEINTAIARLLPIVPVIIGDNGGLSRFPALASLRRRALAKPGGVDRGPLSDQEWARVRAEIDEVLLSSYRRRLALLSRAEQEFTRGLFEWSEVDQDLRIYKAFRKADADPERETSLAVLSHCSIHEMPWIPGLKAVRDYINRYPDIAQFNFKLYLYERDTKLSPAERREIYRVLGDTPFYLIHSDQLRISLQSNFARFG